MKKTVIISGGSDGLGKEIAMALKDEHDVTILSANKAKLEKAAAETGCDYELCDVSKLEDIERVVASVAAKHGGVDCLINNAGIFIEGELDVADPNKIETLFDINVLGSTLLAREVIPIMKKAGRGNIINIVSQGGIYGKAKRSVYAASKFALNGLTKSLEMELSPYNISVTGIYPGKLNTHLFENAGIENEDMSDALDPKEVAKAVKFVLSFDSPVEFTEIGIKHIKQ